jgi:hypothetical protein
MTSRWLELMEAHVEKGILGLTGLFMLGMLWMYLLRSPNTVPYDGEPRGPRELMEAVKSDADRLEQAVRNADAETIAVDDFSDQLREHHDQGIFADAPPAGPALGSELPLAAGYGRKIVVPGLEDAEGEQAGSVVLVTPLRPSAPKLRTGRSLAVRQQQRIAGLEASDAIDPAEEEPKAEQVAWVTVAAYFNKKAQYDEMIRAGYLPYRSNAYVVGADVQRQEVLSTGEYSEWQDVTAGKAMPKLELHEPQFDDETGELINKDEIRQTFDLVKEYQAELMQPPFYAIDAGDFWEIPPLAGYEDDQEAEEEEDEDAPMLAAGRMGRSSTMSPGGRTGRSSGRPSGRPSGRSGGRGMGPIGPPGGGGRGMGPIGPPGGSRGMGPAAGPGVRSEEEERRDARKQIRADLTEAKKMISRKEYDDARRLADQITRDPYASKGDISKAEQVIKMAERWLRIEAERGGARGGGGRTGAGMAPVGRSSGYTSSRREVFELVSNPEKPDETAVWFHDDTVDAGKTYRYRMRVKLWNRYVGQMRAMKDPEQAKQPVATGEWSSPSEPITVTPSTYFFVTGGRPAESSASVDVWKWRDGFWKKERFDVTVGDVIGEPSRIKVGEYDEEGDEIVAEVDFTTGAVVLDLRFDDTVEQRRRGKDGVFGYSEKSSTVLVYLDPADGQVKERASVFDRRDPKKKELEDEEW